MSEKDESDEVPGPRRGWGFVGALVIGLPLLYFLSIGPVVLIFEKTNGFGGNASYNMLAKVYAPVVWLHHNTFLRRPIEAYMGLWGVK